MRNLAIQAVCIALATAFGASPGYARPTVVYSIITSEGQTMALRMELIDGTMEDCQSQASYANKHKAEQAKTLEAIYGPGFEVRKFVKAECVAK